MKYLIRQRGLYWRPHSMGYTSCIGLAGMYDEKEAKGVERNNREPPDVLIPLDSDNIDLKDQIQSERMMAKQILIGTELLLRELEVDVI